MSASAAAWREPSFAGRVGVARRDITPPAGIYSRNWGAAEHDTADSVHRPLTCTVLTARGASEDAPLVLAAIDATWFRGPESPDFIGRFVRDALGLSPERFMLALSHTHSGPSISLAEQDKPGGHLIGPYVESICAAIVAAAREAMENEEHAVMTFAIGRCGAACNRDLYDPERDRYVCGFNPGQKADDTCMVGRIVRADGGEIMATIVNYACHPTTLGARNRLLSPDYVGAMRETIEAQTTGASGGRAPCLFLQGASGELSPRYQYCADVQAADAHGRAIGHAALGALFGMLPPASQLVLREVVSSGAPLAMWEPRKAVPDRSLAALHLEVNIPLKPTLRSIEQITAELAGCQDRAARERLHRESLVIRTIGPGPVARRPVWLWRLGSVLFVGHSDEAYSQLQTELRAAFPEYAVVVMNVVNGWGGYLCPAGHYDRRVYQVEQSPYERGCLETLIASCKQGLCSLLAGQSSGNPHLNVVGSFTGVDRP